MSYRVDNVPWWLKILWLPYSYFIAACFYGANLLWDKTCKKQFRNAENLDGYKNHIFCIWHENLPAYFITNTHYTKPYVWLNHPVWFMKPIHLVLSWMGTEKIVLGSSGHSGKEGLKVVIGYLNKGFNTLVSTDGPHGPVKVVKDGVLQMSLKTGLPIVPVRYRMSRSFRLSTWDRKIIPFPFTTIEVFYEKPVFVTEENYEFAKAELTEILNGRT